MILDLFSYFAKFPSKVGVLSMFTNGSSDYEQYAELYTVISALPETSLIPAIQSYVFGQSFDSVKARIDGLTGCYLFIDYGEFTSGRDNRNSIQDTQKLAATIAMKIPDTADLVEEAIYSQLTLDLLNVLRAHLLSDSEESKFSWLNRKAIENHDIIPFVAKELKSIGWTLMFSSDASDMFDLKSLVRRFITSFLHQ